jgi:guanylate kinase
MPNTKSNLFLISGPSGAGKDSVIDGLAKFLPIEKVITTTSREMRAGESQKNPYYFISREEFKTGIEQGLYLEYAQEYNDNYYGVSRDEIERVKHCDKIGIWRVGYNGVINIKKILPEIKVINIRASLKELENRIKNRDANAAAYIQDRLEKDKKWLKRKDLFDYDIMNSTGKLDKTIAKIAEIIKKELTVDKT